MTEEEALKTLEQNWSKKLYKLKIHRIEEHETFNMRLIFYTVKSKGNPMSVGSVLKQWRIKAVPIERGPASAGAWDMVTRTRCR